MIFTFEVKFYNNIEIHTKSSLFVFPDDFENSNFEKCVHAQASVLNFWKIGYILKFWNLKMIFCFQFQSNWK